MLKYSQDPRQFSIDAVMCNRIISQPAGHIKNFVCLIIKQYIYRQRCMNKNLSINDIKMIVLNLENIEKFNAVKNSKLQKHEQKWYPERTRTQQEQNFQFNYVHEYISKL